MSARLNILAEEYSHRLALRSRMMEHLGLCFTEQSTAECYDDLRETLLSCVYCADPSTCEKWLDQSHRGVPEFCSGRSAFMALKAALEASQAEVEEARTGSYG